MIIGTGMTIGGSNNSAYIFRTVLKDSTSRYKVNAQQTFQTPEIVK